LYSGGEKEPRATKLIETEIGRDKRLGQAETIMIEALDVEYK
jgi:hypothetical protein